MTTTGNFRHNGQISVGNMVIQTFSGEPCQNLPSEGRPEGYGNTAKTVYTKADSRAIFKDGKANYERHIRTVEVSDENGEVLRDNTEVGTQRDEFYCDSKIGVLLDKLANLDGNSDLTIDDLKKAGSLMGIELGHVDNNIYDRKEVVTKVDMSKIEDGIVTFTTTSGLVLHIDAETETEKANQEVFDAKYNISDEEYRAAGRRGREMQDCLHGYTTDGDWEEFEGYINQTNAGNVLQTLRGYEYESCDDSVIWNSERFFQQLFTEHRDNDKKQAAASKMIGYVVEYINDHKSSITDSDKIQVLNEIETTLKNVNLANNMTNGLGKLLDDKMHQLFEIFNISYKY